MKEEKKSIFVNLPSENKKLKNLKKNLELLEKQHKKIESLYQRLMFKILRMIVALILLELFLYYR